MTNEEAINYLKISMAIGEDDDSRHHNEVLKFIIKALEEEPKIVPIAEVKFDDDMLHEIVEEAVKNIEIEPKWIPVSERLPEEPGTYMTTIDYGKYGLEVGQKYYYGQGLGWNDDCVIAWMPLPEPYIPERRDEE